MTLLITTIWIVGDLITLYRLADEDEYSFSHYTQTIAGFVGIIGACLLWPIINLWAVTVFIYRKNMTEE